MRWGETVSIRVTHNCAKYHDAVSQIGSSSFNNAKSETWATTKRWKFIHFWIWNPNLIISYRIIVKCLLQIIRSLLTSLSSQFSYQTMHKMHFEIENVTHLTWKKNLNNRFDNWILWMKKNTFLALYVLLWKTIKESTERIHLRHFTIIRKRVIVSFFCVCVVFCVYSWHV
jgi:hypothetical protein